MELFDHYRKLLKHCGEGVRLNELVKIVSPETVEIGEGTRLCDFVFLLGPLKIGRYCDIQPGVRVWGGGSCVIGDYVSIAANTVILTGEYEYEADGKGLAMVDFAPNHAAVYGKTIIGSHAYIGCNVSIRQGVNIGEGAVIGMGSVVNKDVGPWEIVFGNPAKFYKWRPKCV